MTDSTFPKHPRPLSLSLSEATGEAGPARVLRQAQHERAWVREEDNR